MIKLKLENIKKTYKSGEIVTALRGVSLAFRDSEFVSILGPSGCGKTTMLNIIGGLDRYDSGDLIIGGTSTKKFKDSDWDAYRNRSIGFVFQSYNLIGHQTVLHNVEIALTLSGVSSSERRRRAKEALATVGILDQAKKKPNQLSGGQMQRVAVARALVNNPDIIMADEPTGALDSHTSVQLMDILKEISKTRLVIMVTHNGELAEEYSTRIVRLLDGEIQSDSNPPEETDSTVEAPPEKKKFKKTSMSFATATGLSFKNLLTKRGRTILTSVAGSIGIIGVALVLALNVGLSGYMSQMQADSLSGFPITINETPMTLERGPGGDNNPLLSRDDETGKFTDENIMYRYDRRANVKEHTNILTQDYFDYIAKIQDELPAAVSAVSYSRGVEINLLAKGEDSVVKFETSANTSNRDDMEQTFMGGSLYWQEMTGDEDFILSQYDLIGEGSRFPTEKNEVAIVVDEFNRLDKAFYDKLGMTAEKDYQLTDFIGKTMLTVVPNNNYYTKNAEGLFAPAAVTQYDDLFTNANGMELTITGILRVKENSASLIGLLSSGFVYTPALTDYIVEDAQKSEVAIAQKDSETDVIYNKPFANDTEKKQRLLGLGADTTPTGISIYPTDFEGKEAVKEYLDNYNVGKAETAQVVYNDVAQMIESMVGTMLNTITLVLVAFAAISLLVSTIMIAIIIYVSVIERTKEIGILRSVGARKKDISRVFNVEALLIGMIAGLIGVGLTYLIQIPVNSIVSNLVGVDSVANLPIWYAALLVMGSMCLTLIAGFIPSKMAAKKDPVVALRTE